MNPKRNTTCTRGPWGVSSTSGSGIQGSEISVYRMFDRSPSGKRCLFLYGQLNGITIHGDYDTRRKEMDRLMLLYGYSKYYGRNVCKFVMSRAARKRGYTTTDWMYLSAKKRAADRLAGK